jgi:hypothetical protein
MPISNIKYRRALVKSAVGRFPSSADAMIDRIPHDVLAALTGAQIASLMDAMWDACQEAKHIACQDAVAEGAIWDSRRRALREIAL